MAEAQLRFRLLKNMPISGDFLNRGYKMISLFQKEEALQKYFGHNYGRLTVVVKLHGLGRKAATERLGLSAK
jgi:hypothetical protein